MPESSNHLRLVSALVGWIAAEYFHGDRGLILVDCPESLARAKPPGIAGFVPDVYGQGLSGGGVVIGEAKTAGDLENLHTREQLHSFLLHCAARPGSVFVFAVPWHMTRYARCLIEIVRRTCACEGASAVVLEQLEG
jgi:hypothetical protein